MSLMISLSPLPRLPPLPPIPTPVPIGREPEEIFPVVIIDKPVWLEIAEWVAGWLIENILRPGTEWFIGIVEWILAEIKVLKHNLFEILAELYETDLGFLFITAGTILLTTYLPQLIAVIKDSAIGNVIAKIQEWVKGGVGRLLELTAFVDLVAISDLLAVIWPMWRDLMGQLSEAISGIAEELGEGTGYVHAWISVVHGMVLTSNALLGVPAQASVIESFEKSEEFLRNASENFRRYAHDPGLIVRDIIETYYVPYATRIRDTQASLIESITTNRDEAVTLMGTVTDFRDRVDHWIGIQPAATAAIVEEKFGPLSSGLTRFIDDFITIVRPAIDASITILETRADRIEAANAVAA